MPVVVRTTINETHKGLLLLWDYRFNLLMETIIICCVFVGLNVLIGQGDLPQDQLAATLLGYVIWLYTFMAVSNMGWSLREELQTGTLEQMFMSPVAPQTLIIGRSLAAFFTNSITILMISLILIPLLDIRIPLRAEGVVVLAWTVVGLWGLGFIVGGATLLFKQVESLAYLLQYGVMFLNGSLLPVDRFPPVIETAARLIPGTQGIIVLRHVLLDRQSLSVTWHSGSLPALMIHSAAFFILGWLVFRLCERTARRRGTLGHY